MRAEEIKGLMEAYSHVYETPEVLSEEVVEEDVEVLDEVLKGFDGKPLPVTPEMKKKAENEARFQQRAAEYKSKGGSNYAAYLAGGGKAGQKEMQTGRPGSVAPQDVERRGKTNLKSKAAKDAVNDASQADKDKAAETIFKLKPGSLTKKESGKGSDTGKGSGVDSSASKPSAPASQTVLAKKGGVEGKLDKATGKFTAGSFSAAEKSRYSSASAAKPAAPAKPAPGTKAAGPESIKPKTPNPLMQKTFGYQTGNAPDQIKKASEGKPVLPASTTALGSAADPKVRAALNLPSKPAASLSQKPETPKPEAPKPQMSARAQALKAGGPAGGARERMLNQGVDIFDLVKGHLLDEGYAETEENAIVMMANMSEEWRETIIMELTGGKGHPGYKAGSKDHGDLEDHPAAGKKGGVLSPRYGHHLGDMDDEDEDEDDLESTVKQQSRDSRERVRKPLRDKVKAARKKMSKEEVEYVEEDSRRMSNKQKTASVRQNIKAFGSNFTPPNNYDPDANRGQGEVLTRKQIEKKRRKELRKEENENGGLDIRHIFALNRRMERVYEAQRARENPEDHDKEEKRKYEPVRGEKTPMPPRGDKRREEFEKWYAKQMGR